MSNVVISELTHETAFKLAPASSPPGLLKAFGKLLEVKDSYPDGSQVWVRIDFETGSLKFLIISVEDCENVPPAVMQAEMEKEHHWQ